LGFWGLSLSFGFPLFLWASWVVPMYTSCVLRALYTFFNKIFLIIKKKTSRCIYLSSYTLSTSLMAIAFVTISLAHPGITKNDPIWNFSFVLNFLVQRCDYLCK
jgi:hypothetical protein